MKKSAYIRFSISLLLLVSLFMPVATLAATLDDGKKFFKEGMRAEVAEEWDKAVEQFAMAVAKAPKNPEYRLHLTRALFNASQMYMKKGTTQAAEKDYAGAYISFRKAYGYDPTNELAKAEMERMVRMQKEVLGGNGTAQTENKDGVKLVPTQYSPTNLPPNFRVSQRMETLTDVIKNEADLMSVIRELTEALGLNVLFEQQTTAQLKSRKLTIRLQQVTAAKALDYIFLQENLFFQRVGPRTIFVADQQRRQFYQQLVLRTFYLSNANPDDVAKVVQTAIPPQQGRTPSPPLIDKSTNSITIRDTSENIKIIESLIKALDKDRAEVVMDVAIYEVNKSDLLQFGNQIGIATGDNANLTNLGGVNLPFVLGGDTRNIRIPFAGANLASIALGIPTSTIAALQSKQNSKLIASTQIHAFNNQDSSARIGQRVPVRSAQFVTGGTNNNGGVVSNVIQYEQVGLTLKFKPIVFPNQDVQVDMEIESKDVSGEFSDNPIFTERTIKGTARVQNNKTLLLASVAQNTESNGRSGLPLLGLIPILGRLFTAPTKNNRQVDIVIAITPKVIRAPAILPDDTIERPTGSQISPTNSSLEAMMVQEEIDEQLALARQNPTNVTVQLQDRKIEETVPTYTKSTDATSQTTTDNKTTETNVVTETNAANSQVTGAVQNNLKPIDSSVRTLTLNQTSDTSMQTQENPVTTQENKSSSPIAELQILPTLGEMKKGEKTKLAIMVRSGAAFRSAILGLKFDKDKLAVRSVSMGEVFGSETAQKIVLPFINENGKMYVNLASSKDTAESSSGVLAYIEVEALADGKPTVAFEGEILNFLTADGKTFIVKF